MLIPTRCGVADRGVSFRIAFHIRTAEPERDGLACAEIYAPYVRDTAITFEYEPPDGDEFRQRIADSLIWLIAESDGDLMGYAYASRHRERAAYQWAADAAVYILSGAQRRGVGGLLCQELFRRARAGGLRTMCAGVTQPNEASNRFHEAMGFESVGTYRSVGWKADSWHDVTWYQLDLTPGDSRPPGPLRLATS